MSRFNLRRIFRKLQKDHEWEKRRRLSDHRAASLAVRLTLTGALQPPRFSGWWQK